MAGFDFLTQGGPPSTQPAATAASALDTVNNIAYSWNGKAWLAGVKAFVASGLSVTGFNGGGQASAAVLPSDINVVTTTVAVAPPFDSVKLPPSFVGRQVVVINNTANPIQVFGSGTDTINSVATATGISQPAFSVDTFTCGTAGAWFVETGVGFAGSFFTEFSQDNVSAAGTTQGTATAVIAQTTRLTTVASGTGIILPPSATGMELVVINHGANPVQVYGNGTDTIDDIAAATGVSQMVSSFVIFTCALAGKWYSTGLASGFAGGFATVSPQDNITAAGTTQGTATVLPTRMMYNVTTTPASSGVLLPPSQAGTQVAVMNNGANSLLVYPNGTETINALGAGVGLPLTAAAAPTIFYCFTAGKWFTK